MTTIIKGKILRNDIEHWDGVDKTKSRKDSTGGTISGLVVGSEVDVLASYGANTNYTRQAIQDCVNRIGSASVTLVFNPGTWTIDDNLTIGSNFTCRVPAGCVFSVSSGKTLTFSGPVIRDSNTWTSGSGTVTENGTRYYSGLLDLTSAVLQGANPLVFEGATANAYETKITITDPTADRTLTIPDADVDLGTIASLSASQTWTGNNIFAGTVTMTGKSIIEANASIAAHATTMDPWSLGNYVTLTGGAVTFTALADAPQAGAEVELYMNAAHVLTDGAVFEVDGDANFTAEAGDRVLLRAKSTTVFTVHPRTKTGKPITPITSVQAEVATTSGTAVTIASSVPSWVKSFAIGISGLSTNGTSVPIIQFGDAGGYEITGYTGTSWTDGGNTAMSAGFIVVPAAIMSAADAVSGIFIFTRVDSATQKWAITGGTGRDAGASASSTSGYKTLSDTLTQVRITMTNGTDAFDAGAVSITYLG